MILFHVPNLTDRWSYTLDFIFELRGVDFEITSSQAEFEESTLTKFTFLDWGIGSLLKESSLTRQQISKREWKGEDCLAFDDQADPVSSIFYVLSRMEEYIHGKRDSHGRYKGVDSLQFKYKWLEKCICDRWAMAIISEIEKVTGVSLNAKGLETRLIPTFDIDNAYAYQYKKGKRKFLSIGKDLVTGNFKRLKERKQVLSGNQKDPYDSYELIKSIAKKFPVHVFWLVGDYGTYDKNISIKVAEIQGLIRDLDENTILGIHPSYMSNSIPLLLKTEKDRLTTLLEKPIQNSRQHFLKLTFPQTFRNLILHGIEKDYSMGFADVLGFRNGTAHAFPWFDLLENKRTELILQPFAYMDGTLNEYLLLSPSQAKEKIKILFEEVHKFGGDFVFIWHNETISEYGKWKGWYDVLDFTLTLKKE